MAQEILDVITRLSYDANTQGLDQAFAAVNDNIKEIATLSGSIQRLEEIRSRTDRSNLSRIAQIDRAIENRRQAINRETQSIQTQIQTNSQLQTVLTRQIGTINNVINSQARLQGSSRNVTFALTNLNYVVQDLPFGFIGIANNIAPLFQSFQQLIAETGSVSAAMAALKTSVLGAQGLLFGISILTTALTYYSLHTRSAGAETQSFDEKIKKTTDDLEKLLEKINESEDIGNIFNSPQAKKLQREIDLLKAKGDQEDAVYIKEKDLRNKEIADLQKQEQAYKRLQFFNVNQENAQQQLTQALPFASDRDIKKILEDINKGASISGIAIERQAVIAEKIRDKQSENDVAEVEYQKDRAERLKRAGEEAYKNALQQIDDENTKAQLNDHLLQTLRSQLDTEIEINKIRKENRAAQGIQLTPEEQKIEDENFEFEKKRIKQWIELRTLNIELSSIANKQKIAESFGNISDANKFQLAKQQLDQKIYETETVKQYIQKLNDSSDVKPKLADKIGKNVIAEFAGLDDKGKKNTQKSLKEIEGYYQNFAQTIVGIITSIYERQIGLLDKEIQIRQDRVAQATELAERGNSEILKSEQERLDEAQKKREETAKKQLQINALLQASSAAIAATQAIQTVTNAGATGDPYSTAARIAAAVAALAAGFAFVSNLVNAFRVDSFAEGVVDYKGKGTGKSDSNLVRISAGESVITATATQQYKPLLEAMNQGIPMPYLNPYVAMMPQQKSQEFRSLQKEMRLLREAYEGSGISVHTGVTNGHIATIVESQRKFEQRRRS